MNKAIALYLHVHQPYRVRHYTVFDSGTEHDYFDAPDGSRESNKDVLAKVAEKSYLPTNQRLLKLLQEHPEFKVSLSITGTVIEQLERWAPKALQSFKELVQTGRVEIVGETYHHSLAFFYSQPEFEVQVDMHRRKIEEVFGQTPQVFRNTELAYNNELAKWADEKGYKAILAEGWDAVLDWRSPNFVYEPVGTNSLKLLLKNYKLSDDIAFRFGDRDWAEWPLTADKFSHWLSEQHDAQVFNLFMDYETFGEHQWQESGIFNFLESLPQEWLQSEDHGFVTVSEAADCFAPKSRLDMPNTVTWADTERDLSAWLGNGMQDTAISSLYELEDSML